MQHLEMETLVSSSSTTDSSSPPVSPTLSTSRRRRRSSQMLLHQQARNFIYSATGQCLDDDRDGDDRSRGGGGNSTTPFSPTSAAHAASLKLRRSFSFAARFARGRIRTLVVAVGILVVLAMLSNVLVSTEMSVLLEEVDESGGDETKGGHNTVHVHGGGTTHHGVSSHRPSASPSSVSVPTQQQAPGNVDTSSSSSSSSSWNQDTGSDQDKSSLAPPPLMDNASHIFMSRWCDVEPSQWLPTGPKAWQQRAPYVLVPGAKHSGGEVLARALALLHPQRVVLASSATLGQFYPQRFRTVKRGDDKTHVALARARMYARDYATVQMAAAATVNGTETGPKPPKPKQQQPISVSNLVGIDYTSGYMFYPPTRILCVMPWIKLLVVVRDPIDRVLAHFLESRTQRKYPGTIDDWLRDEWNVLKEVGLTNVSTWKNNATALEDAWYRYQLKPREGAIGRSLYEMQLRHWLEAMRAVGHDVSHDVMVVHVEDLRAKPQPVLDRISAFLGMKPSFTHSTDTAKTLTPLLQQLNLDEAAMSSQTKSELETFFKPFNRRWKRLIRTYKIPTTSSSAAGNSTGDG